MQHDNISKAESIYDFKEQAPLVVKYDRDDVSAPELPPQAPPRKRHPPVPRASDARPRMRASSVQSKATVNAGRQIISSQQQNILGTVETAAN